MKNKIKIILILIITIIITSSITAYATYNYLAKDIAYTQTNETTNIENVEQALNDLYKRNKSLNINEVASYNYSGAQNNKDLEIVPNLEGKFILVLTSVYVTPNVPILAVNKFTVDNQDVKYNISKTTDKSSNINGEGNTMIAQLDLKVDSKITINCNWIGFPIIKIFKI